MKQYLELLKDIKENGELQENRTGTDTVAVFGREIRFNLNEGFPLLTTKKIHIKSILHELFWFLGNHMKDAKYKNLPRTNIKYLKDNGVTIWDEWADKDGNLGPVYGKQWTEWFAPECIEENVNKAVEIFKKMGIEVKEISLLNTKYAVPVYYIIQPAEVSSNLGRYDGIRFGEDRDKFGAEAKRRIMLGTYVLSAGYYDAFYLKAQKVRSKIIEDFDRTFESVDAIISPTSPNPPFKIGEKANDPLQMYLADVYTAGANLAGIPGLSIPFEFSKKGLPLGFQLLGPRFSENALFDIGKKFHKEIGFEPKLAK